MSTLSSSSSNHNNNNGRYYNDANHSLDHNDDDNYEPSTSYYMVQDSCQSSLDEKHNTNALENESKLSTILQSNHTNESHCQHFKQPQEETTISSFPNKINYILNQMKQIYRKETLLVEVLIVIMLAKIYPRIGTDFVFPEITAHWIAVMTIFCK